MPRWPHLVTGAPTTGEVRERCNVALTQAEYSRRYRQRHPERRAASQRRYYEANRESVRAYHRIHESREEIKVRRRADHLRRTYGITLDEFEALKAVGCPCGRAWDDRPRSPMSAVVDHDATTGEVRGVIHHICNRGLGMLGDDREGLARWMAYLP